MEMGVSVENSKDSCEHIPKINRIKNYTTVGSLVALVLIALFSYMLTQPPRLSQHSQALSALTGSLTTA